MKLTCDFKLDNYRIQAMIEKPKEMFASVERQVKANIAHEVAKSVEVVQVQSDPEVPILTIEEIAAYGKDKEFNAFGTFPEYVRPHYQASVYVFTPAQMKVVVDSLINAVKAIGINNGEALGAIKAAGRVLNQ